jgi:cytochrome c-type biogenesis protein CcmF
MRADCSTPVKLMRPRLNRYPQADQAVATPDVRTGFVDDVYLSLSSLTSGGTVSLEMFVFPLMWFLWFGGIVAALGGLIALRARHRTRERAVEVSTVT